MKTRTPIFPILAAAVLPAFLSSTSRASEVATEGAEMGHWTMDYEAAQALAEEENKPMLLNFTGSDWCGWCIMMDEAVYATDSWKDYAAENLVLVTLDFPRDKSIVPDEYVARNEQLREKFAVQGYPTYILLDSDGETRLGQLGAGREMTPEKFIEQVEGVLRFRPANIEAKVAELGEEKGEQYRTALTELKAAEKELEDWLETQPQRTEENEKKFAGFIEKIEAAREAIDTF